jgi:MFS family permease
MPPDETTQATSDTRKKPRYFYGWNIVAATFLSQLSYLQHFSSVLGFFMRPLNNEFGWSRTQVSMVQSIAVSAEAGLGFFVGPLIDRYGPRYLMPIGAIIVGLTMIGTTYVDTIWKFWLLRGAVVAVGFTLMGGMVSNVTINKWFVRKRGRAIGIASMGGNLGQAILLPTTVWILALYGWRASFVFFAVVTWLVVLVPSYLLMRRQPEDMGLHPDGVEPDAANSGSPLEEEKPLARKEISVPEPVWSRREVMATAPFWLLIVSISMANLAFQGFNISLAPYMQDLSYGDAMVATLVTFRSIAMTAVLPMWGLISERAHLAWVRSAPFLLQGLASVFFLLAKDPVFLWLAVATFAVAFAGFIVIQEVLWANYFGRLSLGLVRSTSFPIVMSFSAIGPIFMSGIFDILGSYRLAFLLFIILYGVAAALIWILRAPTPRRYATPEEMGS